MPPNAVKHHSLKDRVTSASIWILLGHGGSQALRLGLNLALTRILFPEAFGEMAVVFTVIVGINLITDLGVSAGVIANREGNSREYLNTTWTLQLARGIILAAVLFLGSDSIARMVGHPGTAPLLKIAALSFIFSGLQSTKPAQADRSMHASQRVKVDLSVQCAAAVLTIGLALLYRSVEALAWGQVFATALQCLCSHWLYPGASDRLSLHRKYIGQVIQITGLAMLSSCLTYFSGEGTRLYASSLISARDLGLISLAGAFAVLPWQIIQQVATRVLVPAYTELARQNDHQRFLNAVRRARRIQLAGSSLLCIVLFLTGNILFDVLFDSRYSDGGQVLRIQVLGVLGALLVLSYHGVMWSQASYGIHMITLFIQGVTTLAGIYIGFHLGGWIGVVSGTAAAAWANYILMFPVMHRLQLTDWKADIAVITCSVALLLSYSGMHS